MSDRADARDAFLQTAGWGEAARRPLAGDASGRSYLRLARGTARAVLMDAPPESGEDVRPFLTIAAWLKGLGLSAPEILAADETLGFLLLEDLGDDLFARLAARDPAREEPLYLEAVRLLLHLREAPPPAGLAVYDAARLADFAALAAEAYAGRDPAGFAAGLQEAFAPLGAEYSVCLRDFHAENLLWLPERAGLARVGLLDFQDALLAHPVYDLVSLLQDARREVGQRTARAATALWLSATGQAAEDFARDYALCGAQRAIRIIGVFASLAQRKAKPRYLDLLPRVWAHLIDDLAAPGLGDLRRLVTETLPPPTPDHLARLRSAR